MREHGLYPPVKAFLEAQDYAVKGEIDSCDVVAIRGGEPPVIVELKTSFSLPLVFQGSCPSYKFRPAQKSWSFGCSSDWLGWLRRRTSR